MINLIRIAEPKQLVDNKAAQIAAFLASARVRPYSYQYASAAIRQELCSISFNKCFYCERELSGNTKEVDHYIEISCDRTKALDWDNLFLSCESCNNKINHSLLPVTDALNPFIHTNEQIEEHLTFELDIIRPKNNSVIGMNTIKKFRLNSESSDLWRSRFLNKFFDEFTGLQTKCTVEGNRAMTLVEKEQLLKYSYCSHPFSLMFKIVLRRKGLIA